MTRIKRNLGKPPNLAKKVYVNVYVHGPERFPVTFVARALCCNFPSVNLTRARAPSSATTSPAPYVLLTFTKASQNA